MSSTTSSTGCTGGAAANSVPGSMVRWYWDRCMGSRASAARTSDSASPRRLTRQRVHEVQIEIGQARGVQLLRGATGLVRRMDAAKGFQLPLIEALGSQRYPGNARGAILGETAALDGSRVGLERDLDVRRESDSRARMRQKVADGGGRKQAGRSAAQKNAASARPCDIRRLGVEITSQRVDVTLLGKFFPQRVRIEIAVRAFLHAPGKVRIQGERWQRSSPAPRKLCEEGSAVLLPR